MKYLLVLGVVLFAVWLWRRNRDEEAQDRAQEHARRAPPTPPPPVEVADMVACAHCGLHVPRGEAVAANGRLYCSDAHRQAHQA